MQGKGLKVLELKKRGGKCRRKRRRRKVKPYVGLVSLVTCATIG